MFKKKRTYFVVYFCVKNKQSYTGNTTITIDTTITTCEDIRNLENAIKEKFDFESIVLINLVELK